MDNEATEQAKKNQGKDVYGLPDREIVYVERPVSQGSRRVIRAFMLRAPSAQLEELLPTEMFDAMREIEFCYRYRTNDLDYRGNLKAYGIVNGGEAADELAEKLLPYYDEWKRSVRQSHPSYLHIAQGVIFEGKTLRECSVGFQSPTQTGYCLMFALNEYCILRGWGNVWGKYDQEYCTYVYVIGRKEDGPYKIGYSETPQRRLRDMQVGSPDKLYIHYIMKFPEQQGYRVEKKLHEHFKDKKVRGEWFNVDLEEIKDTIRVMYPDGEEFS